MICKKCGAEFDDKFEFCPMCGCPVEEGGEKSCAINSDLEGVDNNEKTASEETGNNDKNTLEEATTKASGDTSSIRHADFDSIDLDEEPVNQDITTAKRNKKPFPVKIIIGVCVAVVLLFIILLLLGGRNTGSNSNSSTPVTRTINVGDTVTLGVYDPNNSKWSTPIEWIVVDDNTDNNLYTLLSAKVLYDEQLPPSWNDGFMSSIIRSFLNEDFYENAFTQQDRDAMGYFNVHELLVGDYECNIKLPDTSLIKGIFPTSSERICEDLNGEIHSYWTQDGDVVGTNGDIISNGNYHHESSGVRPIICIDKDYLRNYSGSQQVSGDYTYEDYIDDNPGYWQNLVNGSKNDSDEMKSDMYVQGNVLYVDNNYTDTYDIDELKAVEEERYKGMEKDILSAIDSLENETGIKGISIHYKVVNGDGTIAFEKEYKK